MTEGDWSLDSSRPPHRGVPTEKRGFDSAAADAVETASSQGQEFGHAFAFSGGVDKTRRTRSSQVLGESTLLEDARPTGLALLLFSPLLLLVAGVLHRSAFSSRQQWVFLDQDEQMGRRNGVSNNASTMPLPSSPPPRLPTYDEATEDCTDEELRRWQTLAASEEGEWSEDLLELEEPPPPYQEVDEGAVPREAPQLEDPPPPYPGIERTP